MIELGLEFELTRPSAKMPTRGTEDSVGLDLYTPRAFSVNGTQHTLIKLGIKTRFNRGWAAIIKDRSGVALKHGITVLAGVIDPDYRDEWGVVLYNKNPNLSEHHTFEVNERIAQVIFTPVWMGDFTQVDKIEGETARVGGFGSTGD